MSKFIKFGGQEVQFFLIFQNVLELNNYYVHNNKLTSSERKQLLLHRSGTETIIDLSMPTALDCKVKSLIKQQQKQKMTHSKLNLGAFMMLQLTCTTSHSTK